MLPLALHRRPAMACCRPPLDVIAAILALALVSTAFAYILYLPDSQRSRSHLRIAGHAAGAACGHPARHLFLGETLSLTEALGLGLIALGLLSLDNRLAIKR
jgi:drug/metabolite transporter (DMT)-like permease